MHSETYCKDQRKVQMNFQWLPTLSEGTRVYYESNEFLIKMERLDINPSQMIHDYHAFWLHLFSLILSNQRIYHHLQYCL